jgi:nucleoside-diphosphate-sugar epimerase
MSKGHQLRVLHAAVSMNPSLGVIKQMEWEQQAANKLAISWTSILHTPQAIDSDVVQAWDDLPKFKLFKYFSLRKKFYQWLLLNSKNYDLILLRFSVHDPWQSAIAKKIGHKLLTIHHTKEGPELVGVGGVYGGVAEIFELIFGRITLRSVVGVISVTPEIYLYQKSRAKFVDIKPGLFYPNGINYNSVDDLDLRSKDLPEIVFMASHFAPWHGLDLLISDAKINTGKFKIHLVGKISAEDLSAISDDHRFFTHGHLNTLEIKKLTQKMWVGLSSFAMGRNGMQQACTLKVREYLQMGLPVYAGHRDTGLPDSFDFYKQGAPNLNDILAYAHQMRCVSRGDVSVAAEPYISKVSILAGLYAQLQAEIFPKLSSYAAQSSPVCNENIKPQSGINAAEVKLIAVTGASGFIGSALVQKLLQQGFKVRALTRQQTMQSSPSLEWFVGDLQTTLDWSGFLQGVDIVVNTAAEINNTALMHAANVDGPLRMLNAASSCGVKRWVQLSSVGAYGPVTHGWVSEDTPTNPQGSYEKTKTLFDEALVKKLKCHTTQQYCIVRPSNVYGPGMRNQSLNQMQCMLKKGWFAFIGAIGASANYVHIDDVVNAVVKGALHPAAANQTYIVSDWTTLENMVLAMAQAVKANQPNLRVPLWLAKFAAHGLCWLPKWPLTPRRVNALSNRSRYSTQKIENELGWHVTMPVVLGVRQLVGQIKP